MEIPLNPATVASQPGPATSEHDESQRHLRTDHLVGDLRKRAISGTLVTAAAQASKFALNLISAVVLARLLMPEDFGLVAMVTTITGFLLIFKDAGLSTATIQRAEITHAQVSNLFWMNVGVSAVLSLIVAALAPLLIQPYVAGTGEGIFGFATNHGVEAWSGHRRLRMMNPHGSGSSACISQGVTKDLLMPAERFALQTGWRGLFMIELLRDTQGNVWFMEFNGRPWGSIALARRQGLEYPAWNVQLALDQAWNVRRETTLAAGLVCRNVGRELLHPLFVLRGPKSTAITHWPSFWESVAGVARINRQHSFYNWRQDDLGVFVSDCFYTLCDNLFKSRKRE